MHEDGMPRKDLGFKRRLVGGSCTRMGCFGRIRASNGGWLVARAQEWDASEVFELQTAVGGSFTRMGCFGRIRAPNGGWWLMHKNGLLQKDSSFKRPLVDHACEGGTLK
eukprot:356655-Chlamydomonas_euryale.AAC.2